MPMEPIQLPIEVTKSTSGTIPNPISRLLGMESTNTAVPLNTVEFHFTVSSDPDIEDHSGLGVMSLDQTISITKYMYTYHHHQSNTNPGPNDDNVTQPNKANAHGQHATKMDKDFISQEILYRNGCTAHSYSPHAHLVPMGSVRISKMVIGDPIEFAMAMDNVEFYEDFEASFLDWLTDQELIRCYRLEEDLVALEMEDEINQNEGTKRALLERHHGTGYVRDLYEGMNSGNDREEGALELDEQPHSYSLERINSLRKADGEPSWQTVMNNNAPNLGNINYGAPWKSHENTDTTPAVMTEFQDRRLITEVDGEHRAENPEMDRKGPTNSYLPYSMSSIGIQSAIAYLPFLPWWMAVCLVFLACFCIWCGIKMVKKLAEIKRMKAEYQPVRRLTAPRNSNLESRYSEFPTPDISERSISRGYIYEEEEE